MRAVSEHADFVKRKERWASLVLALWCCSGAVSFVAAESPLDFDEHIRPILEANCYKCHGEKKQKGKLRLDAPGHIRKGGDSGEPLFVAGKRAERFSLQAGKSPRSGRSDATEGEGGALQGGD